MRGATKKDGEQVRADVHTRRHTNREEEEEEEVLLQHTERISSRLTACDFLPVSRSLLLLLLLFESEKKGVDFSS